mgnify:CR=1 FL=1
MFLRSCPMRDIAETIARQHGVTLSEIRSLSRRRPAAWARQEVISALVLSGRSQSAAARFVNRTYWTAAHALEAVSERRALAKLEAA